MKICPNCREELPDQAHFCPKCMYQYKKKEYKTVACSHRKKRILVASGILGFAVVFFASAFMLERKKELAENQNTVNNQRADDWDYRTGDSIAEDSYLDVDFRHMFEDFSVVQEKLGEETDEAVMEEDLEVHTFHNVKVGVDQEGNVRDFLIDYTQDTMDVEYGVFTIGSKSTYEDAVALLGSPNEDDDHRKVGFYFSGIDAPELWLWFAADGSLEQLEYYY